MIYRTLFSMIFALAIATGAPAASPVERKLADRWDTLRFGYGIFGSDYYFDHAVFVLNKTAEGGVLFIHRDKTTTSRTLTGAQVAAIIVQLGTFFADAGPPPPPAPTEKPIAMRLFIEAGFGYQSFSKNVGKGTEEEGSVAKSYFDFLDNLAESK